MQSVPALYLRGKTIRLRGLVRATPGDTAASAALWLRVDRAKQQMGFFDNMNNRPIRETEWREYVIEGPVAEDATNLAFGVMVSGAVTADFEAISLEQRDAAGGWTPIPIKDPGFESTDTGSGGWTRTRLRTTSRSAGPRTTRRKAANSCGSRHPPVPPPLQCPTQSFSTVRHAGTHADIDLGVGAEGARAAGTVRSPGGRGRNQIEQFDGIARGDGERQGDWRSARPRHAPGGCRRRLECLPSLLSLLGRVPCRLGRAPAAGDRADVRRDDARRASRRVAPARRRRARWTWIGDDVRSAGSAACCRSSSGSSKASLSSRRVERPKTRRSAPSSPRSTVSPARNEWLRQWGSHPARHSGKKRARSGRSDLSNGGGRHARHRQRRRRTFEHSAVRREAAAS